jgi:hypothetical protein
MVEIQAVGGSRYVTPSAQKGQKKTCSYFLYCLCDEHSVLFLLPRGPKHYPQLKIKKKYEQVFFWPFWAEGVMCAKL